MIEFTESQRAAIEMTGGDVYVSAAAGSGKTAVLAERIIHIISDEKNRTPADRLLVVTFTKAAAAEMSARVNRRAEQLLRDNPGNSWLERQTKLIKRANISTVHSFCASLAREFWGELGVPPDFEVAGDILIEEMREQALLRAAERLYGDESGRFCEFSNLFGRARNSLDALESADRFERFLSDIASPDEWKENCLGELRNGAGLWDSRAGRLILARAREDAAAALETAKMAFRLAESDETLFAAYSGALLYDIDFLERLTAEADRDGAGVSARLLAEYAPPRLKPASKADEFLKSSVKRLREEVKDTITRLAERYFSVGEEEFAEDNELTARAFEALCEAVDVFRREYAAIKRRRKVLDYGDLERSAITLLREGNAARGEILSRYDYIFVDEYQDTNEIQDLLFELLKEGAKSFFAVGDVKQSIYRFRRAEPEIFIEKRKNAFPRESGKYPARVYLSHNFRSSRAVIDAVNDVFRAVMTESVGDVSYRGEEELTAGRKGFSLRPGLELRIVEKDGDESEAETTAAIISEMLESGYEIEEETSAGRRMRKCRPEDFCLLLRAKTNGALYEEALKRAGVPVNRDGGGNFFETGEIAPLISLLSVISNPRRDVDMSAAMLSPVFGFAPDDILRLKETDRHRDLYSAMSVSEDARCQDFLAKLSEWRAAAARKSVDSLLIDIIDETGAELLLSAGKDFERRRGNIRMLIDGAAEFSRAGNMSLARFLQIIRRRRDAAFWPGGFSPSKGAVNIMSVHKSKGLEWPVVILADAGRGFNYSDLRRPVILFDKRAGVGLRYRVASDGGNSPLAVKSTLNFRAVEAYQRGKMISEECRVLYVALTRARQKIFVTASVKNLEKAVPDAVGGGSSHAAAGTKNFLSWILAGVPADRRTLLGALYEKGVYDGGNILVKYGSGETARPETMKTVHNEREPDTADAETLRRQLGFVYPRAALTAVPSKVSVSDLAGQFLPPPRAPSFMGARGLDAAARGTAVHQFMQFADYKAAAESAELELERLVERGFISAEYAELIGKESLKRFFDGALGQRLINGEVLREYAFISAVDASELADLPAGLAAEKVIVQGVVDCILFEEGKTVIIDYKTDAAADVQELAVRYRRQLELYKGAVEPRFGAVEECYIYSFHLNEAVRLQI